MQDLLDQYNAEWQREGVTFTAWQKNGRKGPCPKTAIDHAKYELAIQARIKEKFQLSDTQAGYIMGKAYADYHASFSDMFWGAMELAEFVTGFPKS